MLEEIRNKIKALLDERDAKYTESRKLLSASVTEARSMTAEESEKYTELRAAGDAIDSGDELKGYRAALADLEADEKREQERKAFAAEVSPEAKKGEDAKVYVRSEPSAYSADGPHSFFMDAASVMRKGNLADPEAVARFERHNREYRADNVSGDFSSLVVPQYLPEKFAPNLVAGRVTADLVRSERLPAEGMTITLPRATQQTVVAAQSGENTAVASQSYDTEDHTFYVETYAGQIDLSRQSVERGRNIDTIVYEDLAMQYVAKIDQDVINGPGHSVGRRHLGILQTSGRATVTASSTDGVAILRKVAEALGVVNTRRLIGADAIVMAPRRWSYLLATVDASNRPVLGMSDTLPSNAWGRGDATAIDQVAPVGSVMGVPVYTDAHVPTSLSLGTTGADEDVILVLRRDDALLFEENRLPRRWEFEQTLGGNLTIKLVVAGYSAFTAGRYPQGIAVVQGIGLRTPVF